MIVERAVAVPMRDGTILRADVYRPESAQSAPALLCRTCYDRGFPLTPAAALDPERAVEAGFALVCQDVRGRHESDGEFYPFTSEGPDGYDTIEWIAAQDWCSGAVGMAGRSYPAATMWIAAAEQPPHLRAIAPVVIGSDIYHGWVYQGGAFQLGFNLFWVSLMSRGKPKPSLHEQFRELPLTAPPLLQASPAGRFYLDWLGHPTEDSFWSALSPNERYGRVRVPALNIGGWYDIFLGGTLENFARLRREAGSDEGRAGTRLVIGPWVHGSAWGPYPDHTFGLFGEQQRLDLEALQLRFFAAHLRGEPLDPEPPVRIFVMGANRWREEDDWPLARARAERWYLHGDGALSPQAPGEHAPSHYRYDPADPAPTLGGPTSLPGRLMRTNSGPLDQRPLQSRADVLVFESAPLQRPLEVTGPLRLRLWAASTAPDTDFVGKLCDVDADGFSRILAEGVVRTRYRAGYDRARPLAPGTPYEYDIDLVATSNVFLPGHRLRLLVTSSSFPRFDRNPNTGTTIATETGTRVAQQTIFHDRDRRSCLLLPVVDQ